MSCFSLILSYFSFIVLSCLILSLNLILSHLVLSCLVSFRLVSHCAWVRLFKMELCEFTSLSLKNQTFIFSMHLLVPRCSCRNHNKQNGSWTWFNFECDYCP